MEEGQDERPTWLPVMFTAVFLVAIVTLALRPYVPVAHRWLKGSDIGAWNMYGHRVHYEEVAVLTSDRGSIRIPHRQYLWHGAFISTAHPYVTQESVDRFVAFLASRDELWQLVPEADRGAEWQVGFGLRYRKNLQPLVTLQAKRALRRPVP